MEIKGKSGQKGLLPANVLLYEGRNCKYTLLDGRLYILLPDNLYRLGYSASP